MQIRRKVEYRLYPSLIQTLELARICDTCRQVYNWALAERRSYYELTNKTLSMFEQSRRLTVEKKLRPNWQSVHTHALQLILKRVDLAFSAFFRRIKAKEEKPGYPRFKSCNRFFGFGFKEHNNGFHIAQNSVRLNGVGRMKIRGKARFSTNSPKTCQIICHSNKWYISVTYALNELEKREISDSLISGLDWGVETFVVIANNNGTHEDIANPRHLKKQLTNLIEAQQSLSRKKLNSHRRHKAKAVVTKLHDKIRRQRQNFNHQTTAKLVRTRSVIAVEKLSVQSMTSNGGSRKSGLNREILAASPGAFHRMLSYKAEEAGCSIVEIDVRKHKPSQTCSGGGESRKKSLNERWHVLPDGSVISRDLNAARNLLNLALGREPSPAIRTEDGFRHRCEIALWQCKLP